MIGNLSQIKEEIKDFSIQNFYLNYKKIKGAIFFEEDYYSSMGSRDGFLYVDGAKIDDLLNFDDVNCFICIDSNENVIVRETWDGHNFIEDEQFDEKLAKIKENSKGMFATILDIHD